MEEETDAGRGVYEVRQDLRYKGVEADELGEGEPDEGNGNEREPGYHWKSETSFFSR